MTDRPDLLITVWFLVAACLPGVAVLVRAELDARRERRRHLERRVRWALREMQSREG